MDEKVPTISCSAREMFFLASSLGADTLLGVEDPFVGWLTEEIEEAWQQTQVALAARNFIEIQPDDEIVMDLAVAAIVGACAFPNASFVVNFTPSGGETVTRYLHVARQLVVEQAAVVNTDSYQLTALESAEHAYDRILEEFRLNGQKAVSASSVEFPEAGFVKARETAAQAEEEKVRGILQDTGLPDDTAAALAETLTNPVANGTLVALARQKTTWDVAGLGLLEGENGLWRLRAFTRDGDNWVEAIPCTAEEAREAIRRVMNRVLPERI